MASKCVNVLVYSGEGTSPSSIRHATWSLRRILGPNYAVLTVSSDQILKEPWAASCALLVMPGGADSGYCRILNGYGNRRIKDYVRGGGKYLGFCAGGYYGSARCEFEVGKKRMEVVGDRELAFFPGTCRGLAFEGFVYASEAGARAVRIRTVKENLINDAAGAFTSYYNGGGVFVDADLLITKGVEILATFDEEIAVDSGEANKKAAVVYSRVGNGAAIVTGPHPEYSGANLNRDEPSNPRYGDLIDTLVFTDKERTSFLKACLYKLGLEVSQEPHTVPSLSHLHISCAEPSDLLKLVDTWRSVGILNMDEKHGKEYIRGENDTFMLERSKELSLDEIKNAIANVVPESVRDAASAIVPSSTKADPKPSSDRTLDYDTIVKHLHLHFTGLPQLKSTPHFNHGIFFTTLAHMQAKQKQQAPGLSNDYGRVLLYGEVVTSTNTLLEKNASLLAHLPVGLVATATTQIAGRGRGSNVWVSPPGSLMFSVVQRHPLSLSSAPVVFVQYLAAMAVVRGVREYGAGYEKVPVRLKWPNDIYALVSDPSVGNTRDEYVKIGGVLVNSSYAGSDYTLVTGIGLNVNNPGPTTSLSHLAKNVGLRGFELEKLLASILVHFEVLYTRFCRTGFNERFEQEYYSSWLHTNQIVTLEMESDARARIQGITRDWGFLVAEEVDTQGRCTGKRFQLQSDSNSFDFFKGLLKRKL